MVTNGLIPPVEVERPPGNINEAPPSIEKGNARKLSMSFLI
jgi:hypothetical protein